MLSLYAIGGNMKVYAHRGFSGRYPENTMLAFQKAAETGCYGIELDVQLSKDGEVVIIHDETLDRTTTGTGYVRDYTLAELKTFNAAKLWSNIAFEAVPTLEEYLRWVKTTNIVTNIEIKSGVFFYTELEEKTLALVQKYGLDDKIVFSSFNHSSIHLLKKLAPHIPCGALVETIGLGNAGYYCDKFGFEFYHPGWKNLPYEDVVNCKQFHIPINVWTVNDMDILQRMIEWDVEGVITNYPNICETYLNK